LSFTSIWSCWGHITCCCYNCLWIN